MDKFSAIGLNIGIFLALQISLAITFTLDPMARLMHHFAITQSFIIGCDAILLLFVLCGAAGAFLPALIRRKR